MKKSIALILAGLLIFCSLPVFARDASAEEVAPLLAALNIMVGDTDGNLHLDRAVSRAEFTKVAVASSVYRNAVASNLRTSTYKDVPATHWAAPYIKAGVNVGFCKGYSDATFRPDNTVTYEEALTMLLRVLGYSDAEFGNSWPYGQIGLAENLGICDGVDAKVGEALTRRAVAQLVYNTLNTKQKDSTSKLLQIFDAERIEDVLLISKSEKSGTRHSEVNTSKGIFKVDDQISAEDIGKHGDLYVENGDEVLVFIPYEDADSAEKHIVYSMLDNDVVTYHNGQMQTLTVPVGTTLYENGTQTTYGAKSSQIEMGDVLYIRRKSNNTPDYIIYEEGNVEGPFTLSSGAELAQYAGAKILRDGEEVTTSSVQTYDVGYYIPDLNMVLCYSNKITGIYESAAPNKDAPTQITVSGVTYKVESGIAFEKLSSNGSFKYGDPVTLLLGKTNDVADVISSSKTDTSVYGYLAETGRKEYTKSDLSKYTGFYIKIITPDGLANEYIADKDYEDYKNSVRKVTFSEGLAKATTVNTSSDVYGVFDWSNKLLGKMQVAQDVKILDVSTTDPDKTGTYVTVFPERLDGTEISAKSILYAEKNEKNQITKLILNNVTGDTYTYALMTKASSNNNGMMVSGSYTYDVNGVSSNFSAQGTSYNVQSGQGVKITYSVGSQIDSMQALSKVDETIQSLSQTVLSAGNTKYKISDRVVAYKKDSNFNYTIIPLSDLVNNYSKYTLSAYYDKSSSFGGRVRIIVATER